MSIQYEGSSLHKRHTWFGKPPALRCDKTECPPNVAPEVALAVLTRSIAESLEQGLHSVVPAGGHPKYVWGRSTFATSEGASRSVAWEACSSSPTSPMYHAYPIQPYHHSDTMP